jgi:hypothetical protein
LEIRAYLPVYYLVLINKCQAIAILSPYNIKYFVTYCFLMSEENKKKFDCRCGAAFDTVEELDKHNHEAH